MLITCFDICRRTLEKINMRSCSNFFKNFCKPKKSAIFDSLFLGFYIFSLKKVVVLKVHLICNKITFDMYYKNIRSKNCTISTNYNKSINHTKCMDLYIIVLKQIILFLKNSFYLIHCAVATKATMWVNKLALISSSSCPALPSHHSTKWTALFHQ